MIYSFAFFRKLLRLCLTLTQLSSQSKGFAQVPLSFGFVENVRSNVPVGERFILLFVKEIHMAQQPWNRITYVVT